MQVQTDHQIVSFGLDLMTLFDNASGDGMVVATRAAGVWTIKGDGQADTTAANRPDAITAMTEMALAMGGAAGYSTLVPGGLTEMP